LNIPQIKKSRPGKKERQMKTIANQFNIVRELTHLMLSLIDNAF